MEIRMNKRTTGVLLGMVAGDAYLNVRERLQSGKYPYTSSEMRVLHGPQQRAYCEFKCALANKLLGTKSSVTVVKNGPGGRYEAAQFSVSHPYFKMLKGWTYPDGKKQFNQVWLDHMTPEGVALWYMDDGHARRNVNSKGRVSSVSTNIATCCPHDEAELIARWFNDLHKIKFSLFPEGHGYSLRANTENSRLFVHLVHPFIVEPMLYKLSHVADLNSHECRVPVAKCVECSISIFDRRRKGLCNACYSRRYYRDIVRVKR
jgi:hypothetical protein